MKLFIIVSTLMVVHGLRIDPISGDILRSTTEKENSFSEKIVEAAESSIQINFNDTETAQNVETKSEIPRKINKQNNYKFIEENTNPAPVYEKTSDDIPFYGNFVNNTSDIFATLNGQKDLVNSVLPSAPVILQFIPQTDSSLPIPYLMLRPIMVPINNPNILQNPFLTQPIRSQPVFQQQSFDINTPLKPILKTTKKPAAPPKQSSQIRPLLTIKSVYAKHVMPIVPNKKIHHKPVAQESSLNPISAKLPISSKYGTFNPPVMDDSPFIPISPFSGSNARVKKHSTPLALSLNTMEFLPEINSQQSPEELAKINIKVQRA